MSDRPSRGIRLLDLMVVILIVGVLMGLVLLASRSAREASRRTQCQNNMRQLGLGLLGIVNAKGAFPNAGTFEDDPAIHQGDPRRSVIYQAITNPGGLAGARSPCLYSWVVDIIPYLDYAEFYNAWDRQDSYLSTRSRAPSEPSNARLSSTRLGILLCPSDPTTRPDRGGLSYAVNGGFTRWPALPVSWTGGAADGASKNGPPLEWTAPGSRWEEAQAVGRKLGVMFLGTRTRDQPWDIRTSPADISDGSADTLLLGENTLVGASPGNRYSGGMPTNWACPLPNFVMFLGSDDVCRSARSSTECLGGQLGLKASGDSGDGWARANRPGSFEAINYGQHLSLEGSFPFANSGHRGGANFVFCDGAVRFLGDRIDGKVYAAIVTPAGESLPPGLRMAPMPSDVRDRLD